LPQAGAYIWTRFDDPGFAPCIASSPLPPL
jgi:hypothetical protein